LNPPRILVVEDDPDILKLMEAALADAGYRVTTAEDGAEALASARRDRPDLIVLDLMLPRMNALQFRAEQRRDRRWPTSPSSASVRCPTRRLWRWSSAPTAASRSRSISIACWQSSADICPTPRKTSN
jgi:CheY-like chemotaxis protein